MRKTSVKRVNPARKMREFARCYGSKARVEYVKEWRPCMWDEAFGECDGPIENAHAVTDGMRRKAGYDKIAPMCHKHHVLYDEKWKGQEWAREAALREARETERWWQMYAEARGLAHYKGETE